jgi:protein-tyrosine phosphatase
MTAVSLTGSFGRNVIYGAERMLEEGYVHLVASDAHDVARRPPDMATGCELAAERLGMEEAQNLITCGPLGC